MQIQNTYQDRTSLLNELSIINDARDLIYKLKWSRYDDCGGFSDEGFQLLDSIFYYLYDLARVKLMIYETNAVAADS